MSVKELKFDKMEYDTTLAKDFLNQHTNFFGFNCKNEVNKKVTNSIGTEICLGNPSTEKEEVIEDVKGKKKKLWKLSQMIVENMELFCQLEYMIRRIIPDELRAFDLKLITQNLLYYSSVKYQPPNPGVVGNVYMKNDSPLVLLACFAQKILETNGRIDIVSEKDAAIVCWLFADLCGKAGFENQVSLYFVEDIPIYEPEYLLDVDECNVGGCIVVVTGKADIDSAVDVLVEAPRRAPWGVRRVLVQENVLERFRIALKGKSRVCPGEVDISLSQRSTSTFAIGDRIFLIEYAGETLGNKGIIIVEAYRTVKELLSLLSKFHPYALSLWCDSVSESNEIAHNVTSNIVWVNTYGEFDGPPQACLLSKIHKSQNYNVSDSFKQVRSAWEKLAITERAAQLRDLLNEHGVTDINDSFYYVSGSFTCAGTEKVAGTLVLLANGEWYTFQPLGFEKYTIPQLLTYVLKGGSIIFCGDLGLGSAVDNLCTVLKNAGAPVEVIPWMKSGCVNEMKTGNCTAYGDITYNRKFIWTSYGTTFAN